MLSFFPRDVLIEILDLIESVSEGFPTYFFNTRTSTRAPITGLSLYTGYTARSEIELLLNRTTQMSIKAHIQVFFQSSREASTLLSTQLWASCRWGTHRQSTTQLRPPDSRTPCTAYYIHTPMPFARKC